MSNPLIEGAIVPCVVVLRRLGDHPEEERRAYGHGRPDLSMSTTWAPREWRAWAEGRGYSLDPCDPLRAWFRDAAGALYRIICTPQLHGPALEAWTAGVSGWAAELLGAAA